MKCWRVLALLLPVCALHAAPAAVQVRLPAQVEVPAGPVVLGQVALLTSPDLDLLRRLVDLPLGPAPSPGRGRELDRARLQHWIASRTGLAPAQIAWQGAAQAAVRVRSHTVPGSALAGAALRGLQDWLQQHEPAARAELAEFLPRDLEVADAEVRLQARPAAHAPRGRALVWVDVWQRGQVVRSVPVRLQVHHGAAQARESVAQSAPPRQPPVVQRGTWAWMHSRVGAVESQVRVEVLQDGRPGERIRVRQAGAAQSLLASVLAPGRLEVAP